MLAKVRTYFEAGSRGVWLVDPNLEVVHVYDTFTNVRVLVRGDVLNGGDIIPGFELPLETLFQGEPAGDDAVGVAD